MQTRRMLVRLAALAAIAVPSAAWAQTPAAAAPAKPGSPKLIATWEGTYVTGDPSGAMTLVVAKEGAAWKLTTTLTGEVPPPGEMKDIKADGGTLTWTQNFGDYEVHFVATLSADGTKLDGTLEAFQAGSSVGGGTFNLTKKP